MGFLFKSGDEVFSQGMDLIGRKDFSGARGKFSAAIDKGCNDPNYARFAVAMIDLHGDMSNIQNYRGLIDALEQMPAGAVRFGVTTGDRDRLIANAKLSVEEIQASLMPDSDYMAKGQAYIEVAGRYSSEFGDANLPIIEMLKGTSVSGMRESLILQANAYEIMGHGAAYSNPKQASEYLQMAYNFRRQIGDSGQEDYNMMKDLSITAKCWICGKQVSGRGIHFMAVPCDMSPMFREKESREALRSSDESCSSLYMCIPCYTAISNRAEDIVQPYYEECMQRIDILEAQIDSLQTQIAF